MAEVKEEEFGLIRPSLIKQLRSILDQYPDDGQILKELIQNAEDAGATEIKFLHDDNTYGQDPSLLHHPGLAQYQGPALYAHNNAVFTEKDWLGIRLLQDSVKEKDPMKVGRFGLGFKSVLHMTDVPSVLSGHRLAFIDPHEKFFTYRGDRTTGYSWHLEERRGDLQRLQHQTQPFRGIFGSDDSTFTKGYYSGTLFRFPLRTSASALSETLYTSQKMTNLFRSFQADAHMVLIFLCSVETIELYQRQRGQTKLEFRYKVEVAERSRAYVRECRKRFTSQISPEEWMSEAVSTTFPLCVQTTDYTVEGGERAVTEHWWLVTLYFAGGQASSEIKALHQDPALSLLPVVGAAMQLGSKDESTEADGEEGDFLPSGHVFCFLPLPIEQKSATGLPVHLHGYFAISQNRRHLKWPTVGQNATSDKQVAWNQCLLREVIPAAYSRLVCTAIQLHMSGNELVRTHDVYQSLPDLTMVNEKWQPLLEPLYCELFQQPVIHTHNLGGSWVHAKDAVFNCLKEKPETEQLLVALLLSTGHNVAKVPRNVLHALGAYSTVSPEVISPGLIRTVLKHNQSAYTKLSKEDKLLLLRYVTKDHDFIDLDGIRLLPLCDGEFTQFRAGSGQKLYLPSQDHPADLLPGLEGHLVALLEDEALSKAMEDIANEGVLQVAHLNKTTITPLIRQLFQEKCQQGETLTIPCDQAPQLDPAWLRQLWVYLCVHFASSLEPFDGLPILALNSAYTELVQLRQPTKVVVKCAVGYTLPDDVCSVLQKLGVHLIEEVPEEMQQHPQVLTKYARLPLPEDVLDAVLVVKDMLTHELFVELFKDATSVAEKRKFREFLAGCSASDIEHRQLLQQLPVFETLTGADDLDDGGSSANSEPRFVSVSDVQRAVTVTTLPSGLPVSEDFIHICDNASAILVQLLGITTISEGDLLVKYLLPPVCKGSFPYTTLTDIMQSVFQRLPIYTAENAGITKDLANLPFIKTTRGTLEAPSSLYDPNDQVVGGLFEGEAVFPTGVYANPDMILKLRQLGLRDSREISATDIFQSSLRLEGLSCSPEDQQVARQKSLAMMEYLEKNPEALQIRIEETQLQMWLLDVHWVAARDTRPELYPDSLPWYQGPISLHRPCDVRQPEWAMVVGSVSAIADRQIPRTVVETLSMGEAPSAEDVCNHLKNVVENYTNSDKARYLTVITAVYDYLMMLQQQGCDVAEALKTCGVGSWVWHGEGFSAAESVVINRQAQDLRPYSYVLPPEMVPYQNLFKSCGVKDDVNVEQYISILDTIKEKHDRTDSIENNVAVDVVSDLQIAVGILNKFKAMYPAGLPDPIKEQLKVPIQHPATETLKLLPLLDCTYCDTEWLRQGIDLHFSEEDGVILIHPDIPLSTAEALEVPTLMSRMLHAEELNISGFGQAEALTSRLKRLIEEYTDGLAIFKELIQNADDAGATEISFLYDERKNSAHMTFLIDEGMKHCQGPALWCYNNAVFTDEDFENITKLGGATKEKITGKIGKFGLGFNAVYNITDVPSFVSRDSLVIFDPHTTHLGRGIRNKGKPGIKIDMRRNRTLIRKLPDQFYPYQGMFDINISAESSKNYVDGTVFRLPLRTQFEAGSSEICNLCYDHKEITKLLTMFQEKAHDMILFTQNVQKVRVLHLASTAESPTEAVELMTVSKKLERTLVVPKIAGSLPHPKKELQQEEKKLIYVSSMLKASAMFVNAMNNPNLAKNMDISHAPKSVFLISTDLSGSTSQLQRVPEDVREEQKREASGKVFWMVSHATGKGPSLTFTSRLSQQGLVPAAAVAVQLEKEESGFIPKVQDGAVPGSLFCFLPLPLKTGLPLHVNGMFALQSDRRALTIRSEDDKSSMRSDWNEALLQDACTLAYVQLLEHIIDILPPGKEVSLLPLWPSRQSTQKDLQPLTHGFYHHITSAGGVPLGRGTGSNVTLANTRFLDEQLSRDAYISRCVFQVCKTVKPDVHMVHLPNEISSTFIACGYGGVVEQKQLHSLEFYQEIFMPNIATFDAAVRDALVSFALECQDPQLDDILKQTECIPVSPDGKVLKRPESVVDPKGPYGELFLPEDGKFPYKDSRLSSEASKHLLGKLGLQRNVLQWSDILERARTIKQLHKENVQMAYIRSNLLLHAINRAAQHDAGTPGDKLQSFHMDLLEIQFLPVMSKPDNYPLKWKGDEYRDLPYCAPAEMFSSKAIAKLGCVKPIFNEEAQKVPEEVLSFLQLRDKPVPAEGVITQFENLLAAEPQSISRGKKRVEAEKICHQIYHYFQDHCKEDHDLKTFVCSAYKDRECIWMYDKFVHPSQVAMSFTYDCAPYLYGVTRQNRASFGVFLKMLQVNEQFRSEHYVGTLQLIHEQGRGLPLEQDHLEIALKLVGLLNVSIQHEKVSVGELQEDVGKIYLPDSKGVMRPIADLCYNDCSWVSDNPQMNYAHPGITYQASSRLGVKTKREEALGKHSTGIPFGQKESLTNSLKRILGSYPCSHEILFELVQNADDAKASEIHFIKDARNHPSARVFDESWKQLQGPALCVYNNSPFTRADLEGIQRLGEGSKAEDPNRTGQYGIGFSSVYHLTDVPSILTKGEELGEVLCIFDPNCIYVPGATAAAPGRMYENIEVLKNEFADVFKGYLPELYDITGSTMFRFPLRNKLMSERSKISNRQLTLSGLQTILNTFRSQLFDVLLFLNHLNTITVADIDPQMGEFASMYTVQASISKDDARKRAEFAHFLKEMSKKVRAGDITVEQVPLKEIVYTMHIVDNEGRNEKWLISQRVGFGEAVEVPDSVVKACKNGDLNLMPRGGVACLLERRQHGVIQREGSDGKVHCFLPLPMTSNLPVNINGHFALGHENRRHLWTMEQGTDAYYEWNVLLASKIIAPAYVNLLSSLRMYGLKGQIENSCANVECSRGLLDTFLQVHLGYFPGFSDTDTEWNCLVEHVYRGIAEGEVELMPSVQELTKPLGPDQGNMQQFKVKWLPSHGTEDKTAFVSKQTGLESYEQSAGSGSFFGKLRGLFSAASAAPKKTESDTLKEVLLVCGLNLLNVPDHVTLAFSRAGVPLRELAPENVVDFLKSCSTKESDGPFGGLPLPLASTPFMDEPTLKIFLKYCMQDPNFTDKLEGLPLAYCSDRKLRKFSDATPMYVTDYQDLLPNSASCFLHRIIVEDVFQKSAPKDNKYVSKFTLSDIGGLLEMHLPKDVYYQAEKPVEWVKRYNSVPTEAWVRKFWSFVKGEVAEYCKKKDGETKSAEAQEADGACPQPPGENPSPKSSPAHKPEADPTAVQIRSALEPLMNWALIPSKTVTKYFLTPLSQSGYVVDYFNCEHKWYAVRTIMKKLNIPELDKIALSSEIASSNDLLRPLLTTLDKVDQVLPILHLTYNNSPEQFKLTSGESTALLQYFSDNVSKLADGGGVARSQLSDLPLFKTVFGDMISLTGCIVYTLPAKIPVDDMDIWQSKTGTVFLERNDDLLPLYDFLGCASISVADVYCQFVLQHLEYLSEDARLVHLHHLYRNYLKDNVPMPEGDKEKLLGSLSRVPILQDKDGDLQPASEFYDPNNALFQVMMPPDKFPPRAGKLFKESEWLSFLSQLGLVKEVTAEMLVQFVNQVAEEGRQPSGAEAALTKSKVLVQHLFGMSAHSRTALMQQINEIPFIAGEPASPELRDLHSQYGDWGIGPMPYICFKDAISKSHEKLVWTRASVLPNWADPTFCRELPQEEQQEIRQCLKIQSEPQMDTVVEHVIKISDHIEGTGFEQRSTRQVDTIKQVYREVYRFLKDKGLEHQDLKEKLQDVPCVLVEEGKKLVPPRNVVNNLYEDEEIKPYLYKLPAELGEYQNLFVHIGASSVATIEQYAMILNQLRKVAGDQKLVPNELCIAFKAMKGLFTSVERRPVRDVDTPAVYMPCEVGKLHDSAHLVYNNAPAYYDRLKSFKRPFMCEPKEFDINVYNFEDLLSKLPSKIRPKLLTSYVKDGLHKEMHLTRETEGFAREIKCRLNSEVFMSALFRLAQHECYTSGQDMNAEDLWSLIGRLQVVEVYGVERVLMELQFVDGNKRVPNSQTETSCFVEHYTDVVERWTIYVRKDASPSQELLIKLADAVNTILQGRLRRSVLYVIPILVCPEGNIHGTLDGLQIRKTTHEVQKVKRSLLPGLGDQVAQEHQPLMQHETAYHDGEYVTFKGQETNGTAVYAQIRECVQDLQDGNVQRKIYLVDIGNDKDSVIAEDENLYGIRRH